ncbi:hypothetical protein BJ944DRAFT_264420 [Cunninghamella echinulata]|nr:hypothetical protein BJ944DRAFT_264420 [Cunninghamella echinulata]
MTASHYQIKQYNTVQEFLKETESSLEKGAAINTFPLWATKDLAPTSTSPQYYGSIWFNDQLQYVFVCVDHSGYIGWCGHNPLQDYSQSPDLTSLDLQQTMQQLLRQCYETIGPSLQYIQGYTTLGFYFYEQWKKIIIPGYDKTIMDKAIYDHPDEKSVWCLELPNRQALIYKETTQQLLSTDAGAYLRLATEDDLDLLVAWIDQFMIDCNIPLDCVDTKELCLHDIQQQNAYLWCIKDQPMGTIWKRRSLKEKKAISIAHVFIPKEHRSKGYAAAMVTQFSLLLFDDQYQCLTLLMDGKRDPVKNMYASVGYKPIGSFARLQI